MTQSRLLSLVAAVVMPLVLAMALLSATTSHETTVVDASTALAKLKAGNLRFSSKPTSEGKLVAARRARTAQAQNPFAIIVGCADSRVPPETVFDQSIGDLFVIRAAGGLVDAYGLGSIEYAVEHLGVRLVVVLGHERCGAVKAAVENTDAPGNIGALVRDIQPAVADAKEKGGDVLVDAIHFNAANVAAKIRDDAQSCTVSNEVRVVTGYYDLETGVVEWGK